MHVIKVVRNREMYWDFIRDLRNNPKVKKGFIKQEFISRKEHIKFMSKHGLKFFVCLVNDKPAGYAGVIDGDIRVATHPDFQGMGVGKHMINRLMVMFPDSHAKVKLDNEASVRLFESCGFKKKYYILEKDDAS